MRLRPVTAAVVVLAALVLAGCAASRGAVGEHHRAGPGRDVGTRMDFPVDRAITRIPFRNARGEQTTLADYAGKVVVISDSMTLCQEDCPLDTANVVAAARAADRAGLTDRVEFLSVTVDPGRDDRRHLAAYRKLYARGSALPNWQLLTGTKQHIARLWKYFGVYYQRVPADQPPDDDWLTGEPMTYDVEHADEVIFLDARQHERFLISGHAHVSRATGLPGRIRHFLSDEGKENLRRPGGQAWTPQQVEETVRWLVRDHA